MASEEGSNNNCSICLEPLSARPVGAVVPCGHCLHVECWDQWAASQLGNTTYYRTNAKCAMCNSVSSNFVRLFIDFGAATNVEDEDDWSLSSNDDDEEEEEDDTENNQCASDDQQNESTIDEDSAEIIVLDGADGSSIGEVAGTSTPSSSTTDTVMATSTTTATAINNGINKTSTNDAAGDKEKKYKRKAKQLKNRLLHLQADLKQHGTEKSKLMDQVKEQKKSLDHLEREMEVQSLGYAGCRRRNEILELQAIELKRQWNETSEKLAAAEQEGANYQRELEQEKVLCKQQVAKARTHSPEVQQMLKDYNRVKAENKELKDRLQQFQRRWDSMASSTANKNPNSSRSATAENDRQRSSTGENKNTSKAYRRSKEVVLAMEQEDCSAQNRKPQPDKSQKGERFGSGGGIDTSKMSAHAVRMYSYIQSKSNRNTTKSTAAVTDNLSLRAPPAELSSIFASTAASKKRRVPNPGLAKAARRKQKKKTSIIGLSHK